MLKIYRRSKSTDKPKIGLIDICSQDWLRQGQRNAFMFVATNLHIKPSFGDFLRALVFCNTSQN